MRLVQSVKERIMKNGLPEGYTRLEYLQSTGVQYIDTGVLANGEFDAKYKIFLPNGYTTNCIIAGARSSTQHINFGQFETNDRFTLAYLGNYWIGSTSITSNQYYDIEVSYKSGSQTCKINETSVTGASYTGTEELNLNIYLFKRNFYTSGDPTALFIGKLYYFQLWQNGTLVRDFIPALDPSNKPCMYDLVSKQPFYNQGTGADFSIGKKLTPVEYLESTGTQYIKTDYTLTSNTKIDVLFSPNQQSTANLWVIGSYVASNKLTGVRITGETTIDCYINTVVSKTISGSNIGNKYQAVLDGKWTVNGSEGTAVTVSAGLCPLTLFGWNASGTANTYNISGLCSTKIYYCKIWDNGTLARDFIPVRDENNVGYMLDILTNTLYANAGSGSFTIGEDDLVIRNIGKTKFFKQTTRKVPKGFQEVEYLESTGTQYIDTGYSINTDTDEIIVNYTNTSTQNHKWLLGEYETNKNFGITSLTVTNTGIFYNGSISLTQADQYYTRHTLTVNSNGLYNDGVQKSTFKSFASTWNIYLFALNNTGTSVNGYFGYGKIYSYKHKRNGVLIRDFVPYLDANGRPCMWDMVEGKPYYNQGTEEFSYGRKIIPVEYLESTGTQYIDIGIKGKNGYDFEYKFNSTRIDSTAYGIGGEWENGKSCYLGLIRDTNYFGYHYQNTSSAVQVQLLTANTDYTVQAHLYSGEQYYILNGTKSAVGTITGTFTSTSNMRLFSINSSTPLYSYVKMYYCKIWDNGVLVRDYIPCIDENNTPYMFDKVTHSAFLNQGTGQFSYGDIIKERTETLRAIPIIRHLPLNYLEATGTQYINTGLLSTANSKVDCMFGFSTMEGGATNNCAVFGGRDSTTTQTFTFFKLASGNPQYFRFDYNNQRSIGTASNLTWNTTSKYRFEYDGSRGTTTNITTGESAYENISPASTFTTAPITLFAVNTRSAVGQFMKGRIYKYWYTDGTNTIDLIPVLKLPERIPCMYDKISKTYFYNKSTDPFLYG